MKNSCLLEIFRKLDKKELRELEKFIKSPFHNQREDVISLYQYLSNYLKNPKNIGIDKEDVFPHIFANEPYFEKKIRYTISFLYQNIKDFLAFQELAADKIGHQIALIKALQKKGVDRLFEQELKKTELNLQNQKIRNQYFHYQYFLLKEEKYFFEIRKTRGMTAGVKSISEELDCFFIANKLKQITHALTHRSLGQSTFEPDFYDMVMEQLSKKDYSNNPAISVYFYCIKVLTEKNSLPYFQKLREVINEKERQFPLNELQDIYAFALNYCIKKLNAREKSFNREAFELYKQGIEQGVFIENGTLSRFNYKNIVALGLSLKEFEWVEDFITKYKLSLEKKYRESTYSYNLAMLHYRKENYSEAMVLLQKVSTDDVLNNLNSRRMLVRIYYDRGEFDALYSLLNSFQNYLYRKREIGYQRQLYLNFVKFTRRLLQVETYSDTQIEALKKEIEGTKNLAEKIWLLEKIEHRSF